MYMHDLMESSKVPSFKVTSINILKYEGKIAHIVLKNNISHKWLHLSCLYTYYEFSYLTDKWILKHGISFQFLFLVRAYKTLKCVNNDSKKYLKNRTELRMIEFRYLCTCVWKSIQPFSCYSLKKKNPPWYITVMHAVFISQIELSPLKKKTCSILVHSALIWNRRV